MTDFLGFATAFRFSPHFKKWSPGPKDDMSSPRIYTPGDGRFNRQGTSLLYIAGEKTEASAPRGIKNVRTQSTDVFDSVRIHG